VPHRVGDGPLLPLARASRGDGGIGAVAAMAVCWHPGHRHRGDCYLPVALWMGCLVDPQHARAGRHPCLRCPATPCRGGRIHCRARPCKSAERATAVLPTCWRDQATETCDGLGGAILPPGGMPWLTHFTDPAPDRDHPVRGGRRSVCQSGVSPKVTAHHQPDPSAIAQVGRLFKDGEPTPVVRDNGVGSFDEPPTSLTSAGPGPVPSVVPAPQPPPPSQSVFGTPTEAMSARYLPLGSLQPTEQLPPTLTTPRPRRENPLRKKGWVWAGAVASFVVVALLAFILGSKPTSPKAAPPSVTTGPSGNTGNTGNTVTRRRCYLPAHRPRRHRPPQRRFQL